MGSKFSVNWFDRFLIGVAPSWGLRRVQARAAANALHRHYDAAGSGRRQAGWQRSTGDGNVPLRDLVKLRELARDVRRNNGWARQALRNIVNDTVGWGVHAKAVGPRSKEALAIWDKWAKSTACDYDGRLPFYGLQRLAMSTIVESGEVLIVQETASADKLPVPLRIRVLEPDYLDTAKDGLKGQAGGFIKSGIELDGRGRRVAYWLFDRHPGATFVPGASFQSQRIPASKVLHIYDIERPGQLRGVPWFASAIPRLNDFDDYEDAILMQQKIAACFAAFVQDMDGAAAPLGEESEEEETLETLEPGHISYLGPGKQVTFATPPAVANQDVFAANNLRRIAASCGVTYEGLTGDYSKVNFSSARMARLAHWQNVHDWRWNMIIPQLCDGVWGWVMEMAAATAGWNDVPGVMWSPPPMPMLEPEKEGLAYQRLMRAGVMSLPQVIRERGEDPDELLQEIAETNAKLDKLGIVLDSDPRRTSSSGGKQAAGNDEPSSSDEDGGEESTGDSDSPDDESAAA